MNEPELKFIHARRSEEAEDEALELYYKDLKEYLKNKEDVMTCRTH